MTKIAMMKMKAREKGKLERKYAKYLEEGALGDTKKAPKGKIVGSKKRHKETMKVLSGNKDAPNKKIGKKKSLVDADIKKVVKQVSANKKQSKKVAEEKRVRNIAGGNPVKGYKDPIKREMGGKVKYENGGPISNKGMKTFIQRDESGRPGPAYQQQQRPDIGKQGYSDAEQVERWKAVKAFDSAPGGESVLKKQQNQAFTDIMKDQFKKAGKITSKMKKMKTRDKSKMMHGGDIPKPPKYSKGGEVAKHDKGTVGKKKSSFMDNVRALAMIEADQKYKTGKDMNKAWGKTKEKLASMMKSDKKSKAKVAKFKDGGAVKVHEGNVHKSAGEPVTTYQASNSNYKEGK
tara:strand:+ start:1777 stop:2817 length:1041 start_codon:yes stop_codon:yes gene_type:complete